jgi:hypothetical protein
MKTSMKATICVLCSGPTHACQNGALKGIESTAMSYIVV